VESNFKPQKTQSYLKRHPWVFRIAILVIILILAAIGWRIAKTVFGVNQPKFKTVAVEAGSIVSTIRASGTLNPVRSVTIGTQVSGRIAELLVDFNDKVKAGQVIALIDPREFQARYDQALANYELALKNHQFNLKLLAQGFISQQATVVTEGALKASQGALDLTKKSLDDSIIRSPVDGVVVKRSVEVGQTVAASLQSPEIFIIAKNLAEMQVETSIDESDVGRIKEGQEATFTVDAFPGQVFNSKVKQVRKAPVNIQNVVTYTVLLVADNPEFKLLPGMTANAKILVEQHDQVIKISNMALRFRLPPNLIPENPDQISKAQNNQAQNNQAQKPPGAGTNADAPPGSDSSSKYRPGGRSSGSGGNYRTVYILSQEGLKQTVTRKAFRIGITDGESTEILPLRDSKEPELKVGDLVIMGIEGQNSANGGAGPSGQNSGGRGPRGF